MVLPLKRAARIPGVRKTMGKLPELLLAQR